MFMKILVPTDFSPSSEAAMRLAREHVAAAERCLLHVLDPKRIANELASPVSSKDERVVRLAQGPVLITHESRP